MKLVLPSSLLLLFFAAGCEKRAPLPHDATTTNGATATASAAPTGSATPTAARKHVRADAERTTATCTTRASCERDCATEAPGACAKLAEMQQPLRRDARALKSAFERVRASCEGAGDAKACDALASYVDAGIVVAKDTPRAQALWAEAAPAFVSACEHGDHEACRDAADLHSKGRGVARDEAKATELRAKAVPLAEKACAAGDLDACTALVDDYALASSDGPDPRADALRKKLCDAGRADACEDLARALPDSKPRTLLEQKAFASRRRACEEDKDGAACLAIGMSLDARTLAPKYRKPEAAIEWFEKGCNVGDHASCLYASENLARRGKNDEALAFRKRYLDAVEGLCALPFPVACANLAHELEQGELLPVDHARAKQFYEKACASGERSSCQKTRQP